MTALAHVLRVQAAALRAQADVLEAAAGESDREGDGERLLGADEAFELFGVGRDALRAAADRGELALTRGARGKLLVRRAEVERWLAARPYKPRGKRAQVASIADWEAKQAAKLSRGAA